MTIPVTHIELRKEVHDHDTEDDMKARGFKQNKRVTGLVRRPMVVSGK